MTTSIHEDPENKTVRWQAGDLQADGAWWHFEDLLRPELDSAKSSEYRGVRAAGTGTIRSELRIADWCRQHESPERERVHLLRALALASPDEAPRILQRLDCRLIAGRWVSPREWRDWQSAVRHAEQSFKTWEPQLAKLARFMDKGPRQFDKGRIDVLAIRDPAAVPALEFVLSGRSPDAALVVIQTLQQMPEYEASQALARQAVFSNWREVRDAANGALQVRRFEDFVPGLIDLLATPVEMQSRILIDRRGNLFGAYMLARETNDQFQVAEFRRVSLMILPDDPTQTSGASRRRLGLALGGGPSAVQNSWQGIESTRQQADAARAVLDEFRLRDVLAARWNERTDEFNRRIVETLSTISESQLSPDPRVCWRWWSSFNEMEEPEEKPTVQYSEIQFNRVEAAQIVFGDGVPGASCFAAGTPVWTQSGLVPIEQIQPGDLVLAKDVETGELTCLPVLHTTVRQPHAIYQLEVAGERFDATGGHRFWVSGQGWLKVRDLQPKMLLHTATGSIPLQAVTRGGEAATYNLVVDHRHTYFVGRTALLTHDVTLPQPTNRRVPGLAP